MTDLPDYYQILGVRREAGQAELSRAYRQQAMRCHPDHGGSHEAMLRLNEAWDILRDPASRSEYDESLNKQGVQSTAIITAVQRARATAHQYPRRWADFEKWMDSLSKDFTQAEYGWTGGGMWQAPTASNSISGKVLIFIGCGAGLIVGGMIFMAFEGSPYKNTARFAVPICLALGGVVGQLIHQAISSSIKAVRQPSSPRPTPRQPPPRSSSPPPIPTTDPELVRKIKITCPHCGQRIEAPDDVIGTVVTCPTCNKDFHVGKRAPQPPPIPSQPSYQSQPPPIPVQASQPPPIPQQPPPIP